MHSNWRKAAWGGVGLLAVLLTVYPRAYSQPEAPARPVMKKSLQSVSPLLQVGDIEASIAFYTQKLGFKKHHQEEGGFAILGRDECTIFLAQKQTDVDLRNVTARARADGYASYDFMVMCAQGTVDALWKEYRDADVPMSAAFVNGPVNRSYGIRDFNITDPDGYDIVFGEPVEE